MIKTGTDPQGRTLWKGIKPTLEALLSMVPDEDVSRDREHASDVPRADTATPSTSTVGTIVGTNTGDGTTGPLFSRPYQLGESVDAQAAAAAALDSAVASNIAAGVAMGSNPVASVTAEMADVATACNHKRVIKTEPTSPKIARKVLFARIGGQLPAASTVIDLDKTPLSKESKKAQTMDIDEITDENPFGHDFSEL